MTTAPDGVRTMRTSSRLTPLWRQATQVRWGTCRVRLPRGWGATALLRRGPDGLARFGRLLGGRDRNIALDVDAPAGQLGGQTRVLALLADRQRQLALGHDDLGSASRFVDGDVADLGRAERVRHVLRRVLAPLDHVDLLAIELVDDVLDAHAAHAHA